MWRLVLALMACSVFATEAPTETSAAQRIVAAAMQWRDQGFKVGEAEQCMNWTRAVLQQACGVRFDQLRSQQVWDAPVLPPGTVILPEDADSLSADEFGQKITEIEQLRAGDLVFLKNTYGDWAPGVITHVGIAVGNGQYIHRMTSNKGFVRVESIPINQFTSALRLKASECRQ